MVPCMVHARPVQMDLDMCALSEVVSAMEYPCILGANPSRGALERFSYWAARPLDRIEVPVFGSDPLPQLGGALARYRLAGPRPPIPRGLFCGGWMGFLSYDLARSIEPIGPGRPDRLGMPAIAMGFYDRLVAYDHLDGKWWLACLQMPGQHDGACKLDEMAGWLATACQRPHARPRAYGRPSLSLARRSNMTKAAYLEAVHTIKRYILDGEVYQVNFSQRFALRAGGRPIDMFNWHARHNPNPFSAYIDWPPFHIVCTSPELFLRIQDGCVQTRPIKGTRPRLNGNGPDVAGANRRALEELLASPKETAELTMIVDLERNDLARICIPGTRHVPVPRTIESYPTVFHAVAVIEGTLRPSISIPEILTATFPGGSITGAPKIRAMQIIDELEPVPRGLYTGSIGWIGLDGNASLNIAIRTAIITDRTAFVQVGGGIVADSDPLAEYDETLAKARALFEGLTTG